MTASVDLYWLPLGAGGRFVAFNGRVYETIAARRGNRRPLDLYHTALIVTVSGGRFVIENAWPIPDRYGASRGAVVEGPVGLPALGRLRAFRYEVRRWRDGTIADISDAVASPQRIVDDETTAHRVLDLVSSVPALTWGRKPRDCDEMWNSNSVISWLLSRSGLNMHEIRPPTFGRAPGWAAGIALAARSEEETPVRPTTARERSASGDEGSGSVPDDLVAH